jgi:hypothetical protein
MSGRGKRVLVYTVALMLAPAPLMPFASGTREFALAGVAGGAARALSSLYVARGERRLKYGGLLGTKLLAASLITLVFGTGIVVWAIAYLVGV